MVPRSANDKYVILHRAPSVSEFQALRNARGLRELDPEAVSEALTHSLFAVCVIYNNSTIGTGRVIGDGGLYYYIHDVLVSPEFANEGIAELIMDEIMLYLSKKTSPNATIAVSAVEGRVNLYERYGFKESPELCPGMKLHQKD